MVIMSILRLSLRFATTFEGCIMRRVITVLAAVFITCGVSVGQEKTAPNEHLKDFRHIIGTWQYKGPALEDTPVAKKGTNQVFQASWRWILDKNAVEVNWSVEFEGAEKMSGKGLFGWNAADERVAFGGMDSKGSMSLGTLVFDTEGKTSTLTDMGVDAEGNEQSSKIVVARTGSDTITVQTLESSARDAEGPGLVYTLKKISRAQGAKQAPSAKKAKSNRQPQSVEQAIK